MYKLNDTSKYNYNMKMSFLGKKYIISIQSIYLTYRLFIKQFKHLVVISYSIKCDLHYKKISQKFGTTSVLEKEVTF